MAVVAASRASSTFFRLCLHDLWFLGLRAELVRFSGKEAFGASIYKSTVIGKTQGQRQGGKSRERGGGGLEGKMARTNVGRDC